ncbi:aldo/keto reductase [Corallococcus llansteffanensis]|uniref:aldo/keto reductase n=1 Tax=Corallococcus llansteffanensis TaxID=2316731 RepID=UPI00131598AC|nr:aldo/keto reductase [Corallococcus llansteffanensis]
MIYRRLGGLEVSVFALGAANFGGIGSSRKLVGRGETEAEAHALLDRAVALGISLIDTAGTYADGASESFIGSWLASRGPAMRDRVLLSSKVGIRGGLGRKHVFEEVDRTLARLRVDTLDLYLSHVPDPATPWDEVLATFQALVKLGKVRQFGLSNVTANDLWSSAASGSPGFGWVQNRFNLLERDDEHNGVLEACVKLGLQYTPYSPLAGGLLSGKYSLSGSIPEDTRIGQRRDLYAKAWSPANALRVEQLKTEAAAHSLSPAGLATWWLLHCPFVTSVLVGARSPEQLEQLVTQALNLPVNGELWRTLSSPGE